MFARLVVCLCLCSFAGYAAGADSAPNNERTPALTTNVELQSQILERARAANRDLYLTLKSFACREEIQRFMANLNGKKAHPIDRVSANLSFENGTEYYKDILQNKESRRSLSAIAGAWSEGEFGTLLHQTDELLAIEPVTFVAFDAADGNPKAIYNFLVSQETSPWSLSVGSSVYRIPFSTDIWVSVATGEITKIARRSVSIPPETGILQIDWAVTLAKVDLNGQEWLLPSAAEYSVSYTESNRREWNQMSFSNYRRYGSESVLRYNGF